jgi:hypothetical protein
MDKYTNKMYGQVTESAANTLTYKEINTNISIFDKMAFIVHRIEWYIPNAVLDLCVASADKFEVALTSSQQGTTLGLDNPSVIDKLEIGPQIVTAVGYTMTIQPFIRDFSSLPGGGLIIPPRPLFIAIKGTSVASAGNAQMRAAITMVQLSADEYLELVDFYRIIGV